MTALILAKLAGCACVLCCGFLAGNEKLLRLVERRRAIGDLLRLLSMLEENFRYKNDSLPQFFACDLPPGTFAQIKLSTDLPKTDFSKFRRTAGRQLVRDAQLEQDTAAVFMEFWAALGTTPADEECQRINWCRAQLLRALEQLEQKEKDAARLDRMVGLTTAAVLVVLLL